MKKTTNMLLILSISMGLLIACGNKKTEDKSAEKKTETKSENKTENNAPNEEEIRNFLHSTEGTYGWKTTSDDITFDFFKDGRLHIQGPDGEATMWEGKWSLAGDQLTMERADLNKTQTVTAKINGEKLMLDDKTYERIKQ